MIEIIIMKIMKVIIVSQFKVPSQILSFSMVGWFLWFLKFAKKVFTKVWRICFLFLQKRNSKIFNEQSTIKPSSDFNQQYTFSTENYQ